jgi:hypothetical protein
VSIAIMGHPVQRDEPEGVVMFDRRRQRPRAGAAPVHDRARDGRKFHGGHGLSLMFNTSGCGHDGFGAIRPYRARP